MFHIAEPAKKNFTDIPQSLPRSPLEILTEQLQSWDTADDVDNMDVRMEEWDKAD